MPDNPHFTTVGDRKQAWSLAVAVALTLFAALAYRDNGALNVIGSVAFATMGPSAFALGLWCRPALGVPAAVLLTAAVEVQEGYLNPFVVAIIGGGWLVGSLLRSRQQLADQLALRARELEAEREVFATESVRYERARIARELHDIVAHCVSVMVIQAAAGQRVAGSDPELAAEALGHIAATAAQAQAEMARLVELLDADATAGGETGLGLVDELVARTQATGLAVSCRFSGPTDVLTAEAADTAYRIVQESLTNALKHAPGAAVDIRVVGSDDAVRITVTNGRPPVGVGVLHSLGGGHGLGGMRERAAAVGGSVDVGPQADGGWCVAALLPSRNSVGVAAADR